MRAGAPFQCNSAYSKTIATNTITTKTIIKRKGSKLRTYEYVCKCKYVDTFNQVRAYIRTAVCKGARALRCQDRIRALPDLSPAIPQIKSPLFCFAALPVVLLIGQDHLSTIVCLEMCGWSARFARQLASSPSPSA